MSAKQPFDKNAIIGLVLITAILLAFSYLNKGKEDDKKIADKEILENDRLDKETLSAEVDPGVVTDLSSSMVDSIGESLSGKDSLMQLELMAAYGGFSNSANKQEQELVIENEKMQITFSNKGGAITSVILKDFETYDNQPLQLFNASDKDRFNIELIVPSIAGGTAIREVNTRDVYFTTTSSTTAIKGEEKNTVSYRLYDNSTKQYLEYVYTITGNSYEIGFDIKTKGLQNVLSPHSGFYASWAMDVPSLEKTKELQKNAATIYYKYHNDEVDYINPAKYEKEDFEADMQWIMFKHQYFNSTLMTKEEPFENNDAYYETEETQEEDPIVKKFKTEFSIPMDDFSAGTFPMAFYFGPNKYDLLSAYDNGMEESIDYGWKIFRSVNVYIMRPIFNLLNSTGLHIGLVILLMTVFIKLILFPITYKTYMSSAKMRVLKPEIEELNKKYEKDAVKKQQATMKLYSQTGVSPLSGCIPLLIQMPILFALFRFFPSNFDLRQKDFLWAEDLSTYDSVMDLPFSIPFYGDHVSLFTLLMAISMIFYTKVNSQMTGGGPGMEGAMASQMKMMTYLMPIMMLFFFNSYSAGLSYYYLIANLMTIGITFAIRKWFVDEDKIYAKLQANKAKPKKKSGFAKKLEQKMKEAQALQNKK